MMINVSDAVKLHDFAHSTCDTELHKIAMSVLRVANLPHMIVDSLDEGDFDGGSAVFDSGENVIEVFDALFEDENGDFFSHYPDVVEQASKWFPLKSVYYDSNALKKPRKPIYKLYLVKEEGEFIQGSLPDVFTYIPTADGFRKSGAYKFPVCAIRVQDSFTLCQVHKEGDKVVVFDKNGEEIKGFNEIGCKDGIFEALYFNESNDIFIHDVCLFDGEEMFLKKFSERMKIIDLECDIIEKADDLSKLPEGKYIIKHVGDVVDDLKKPFWFVFESNRLKIGQPFRPNKLELRHSTEIAGEKEDKPIEFLVPRDSIDCQIHVDAENLFIFIGDGARNRAGSFKQLKIDSADAGFILKCFVNVEGKKVKDICDSKNDFSEDNVSFYCFDVVMSDGESLIDSDFGDRMEILDVFLEMQDGEILKNAYEQTNDDFVVVSLSDNYAKDESNIVMNLTD